MGDEDKLARLTGTKNLNKSGMAILDKRSQDIYFKLLKTRGQVYENSQGETWILSYPKAPVKLPRGQE